MIHSDDSLAIESGRPAWPAPGSALKVGLATVGLLLTIGGICWDLLLHAGPEPTASLQRLSLAHFLSELGVGLSIVGVAALLLDRSWAAEPGHRRLAVLGTTILLLGLVGAASYLTANLTETTDPGAHSETGGWAHHDQTDMLLHLGEQDLVVTPGQQIAAARLTDETRQKIARYANLDTARADGYAELPGRGRVGGDLLYLYNRAFMLEGTRLEPGRPEALGYLSLSDGRLALVDALFLAPAGEGPRIGGGLTLWGPYDNLCVGEGGLVAGLEEPGVGCAAGSSPLTRPPERLNLWLFEHPGGAFAFRLTPETEAAATARLGG